MISLVPGLRGLAKKSLFYNLFFAPIMFISGFIPAEKGNLNSYYKGLRRLKTDILDRNRPVLVFPETTRSEKNFPSIGKFSVAIFEIAIESQCLIVPVYIQGTDQLMGRGDLFLNPYQPIELKSLPSIHTNQFNSAAELSKYVWNQLADEQKSREPLCS